jgi:Flp pilus assembly protein TadB
MPDFHEFTERREVSVGGTHRTYERTVQVEHHGLPALVSILFMLVAFLVVLVSIVMAFIGAFSVFVLVAIFAAVVIASRLRKRRLGAWGAPRFPGIVMDEDPVGEFRRTLGYAEQERRARFFRDWH